MLKLTPTERRIYELLADGEPHRKEEVLALIDELAGKSTMYMHIYKLRLKLRSEGEDVVAQSFGKWIGYRRVRLLLPAPSNNGT